MKDHVAPASNPDDSGRSAALATPIETLLGSRRPLYCDVLIIGSGYGGAMSALELSGAGRSIWVFERGKEFHAGEFPESIGELGGHLQVSTENDRYPRGYPDGLFDLRIDRHCIVVVGCGLGGTSLINAGVVIAPDEKVLSDVRWPAEILADRHALKEHFDAVKRLLGAAPYPNAAQFHKYQALQRLASRIDGARCAPAEIAVTSKAGPNAVGVNQNECIECGNCVSGCNHCAKNTLTMNVLPLAKTRGAELFVGVTAVRIERAGDSPAPETARWAVTCRRTAALDLIRDSQMCEPSTPLHESFVVRARTVILAAGALGSTELLLRSQTDQLRFSSCLGHRFSGNGDSLDFGYGQRSRVDAVAETLDQPDAPYRKVGPTILGVVRASTRHGAALIEDGAVPSAINKLFGTLLSTAALPYAYTNNGLTGFHQRFDDIDPLALHPRADQHAQVLLSMGIDRGDGQLSLDATGKLRIDLHAVGADPCYAHTHRRYSAAQSAGGFDGGYYLRNPLFKALPEGFEALDRGVPGRAATVHPIGGCVMGRDRRCAVVDHLGTVYDGAAAAAPGALHEGLHVLDGAILPLPLGANPLLTIAGLARRAARIIAGRDAGAGAADQVSRQLASPRQRAFKPTPARDMTLKFTEVLHSPQWQALDLADWGELLTPEQHERSRLGRAGLVLELSLSIQLYDWLAKPHIPWHGDARLYLYDFGAGADYPQATGFVRRAVPLATGSAKVRILALDPVRDVKEFKRRTGAALGRFSRTRGHDFSKHFGQILAQSKGNRGKLWHDFRLWTRASESHILWRTLDYEVELAAPAPVTRRIRLNGSKRLAYGVEHKNVWTSLLELDATVTADGARPKAIGFQVDVLDLLQRRVYQIADAPDTPSAIVGLAAVSGFWIRALLSTHYWSFRGLDYRPTMPRKISVLSPLRLSSGRVLRCTETWLNVRRSFTEPGKTLRIRLSHYRPDSPRKESLLLIHGMSTGGEIFTTGTLDTNMATYFVERGFDVWVLDHRLSSCLGDTAKQTTSIDEIAAFDVPAAVRHVFTAHHDRPINVFAHCVGSAAVSIAILQGRLEIDATARTAADELWSAPARGDPVRATVTIDGQRTAVNRSMIKLLIQNAVHPWVVPSKWNRVSASLAAFYQDVVGEQVIDPTLPTADDAGAVDEWLDRLAASIPWDDAELAPHQRHTDRTADSAETGTAVCNRMTLFYGRLWRHQNLDERTHRDLHKLVGPVHINVFKHIFFLALRQRITNRHGDNWYLRKSNLEAYWNMPTLHCCGLDNQVFDPRGGAKTFLLRAVLAAESDVAVPMPQLYLAPGVGHMDFVIGRHAAQPFSDQQSGSGIYPTLLRYLEDPLPSSEQFDQQFAEAMQRAPDCLAESDPLTGPAFNYELSSDDKIKLKLWCELRPYSTGATLSIDGSPEPTEVIDLTEQYAQRGIDLPGSFQLAEYDLALKANYPLDLLLAWRMSTGVQ